MLLPCFSMFLKFRMRIVHLFHKNGMKQYFEGEKKNHKQKTILCLLVIILSGCKTRFPKVVFQGHLEVKICVPVEASVVLCQGVKNSACFWCQRLLV